MKLPKLTPDLIDAAVIQLRSVFLTDDSIPTYVKESGTIFVDNLDKWSEEMTAAAEKEKETAPAEKAPA